MKDRKKKPVKMEKSKKDKYVKLVERIRKARGGATKWD